MHIKEPVEKIVESPFDTSLYCLSQVKGLLVSKDFGNSWQRITFIGNHRYFDIEFIESGKTLIIGNGIGYVINEKQVLHEMSGLPENIREIAFSETCWYLLDKKGDVFYSSDTGKSWEKFNLKVDVLEILTFRAEN